MNQRTESRSWFERRNDRMDRKSKVVATAVIAVVAILVLLIAGSSTDDFDYRAQAKESIDPFGYDAEIITCEVEKGTNVFGVSIIGISGTFLYDGTEHTYRITTGNDHEVMLVNIDGEYYDLDTIGKASYNYRVDQIGSFEYIWGDGYVDVESPDEGKRFLLVTMIVKNVGHDAGLPVRAPDLEGADGNIYEYDWNATYYHPGSYTGLTGVSVGLGKEIEYCLVFEVPESVTGGEVFWSPMYIDLYGYVLDSTLEIHDGP